MQSISIRQTRVFHIDVAGKPLLWYNYTENHNFSKCAVVFYSTVYFVFSSADTFDVPVIALNFLPFVSSVIVIFIK